MGHVPLWRHEHRQRTRITRKNGPASRQILREGTRDAVTEARQLLRRRHNLWPGLPSVFRMECSQPAGTCSRGKIQGLGCTCGPIVNEARTLCIKTG